MNKINKAVKKLISKTLPVAITLTIAASATFAQAAKGGARLAGTWDAVVTIRDCATGNAIRTFASIANFNQGGTYTGSTSGLSQSSRTPEHGVWRHLTSNHYGFKFKSFNFDPAGNPVTYTVVTHQITLDETADAYTSSGQAAIYLMNGTQVGQGCSDSIGTRFDF